MIEYSKMVHSKTLHDVNSLGLYTIFEQDGYVEYYGGLDFTMYEPKIASNSHLSTMFTIGISGLDKVAPYAAVGTGLSDILFGNNNGSQSCSQQNNCDPDFYFRAGARIGVTEHITIGAYYEGVRFNNAQTTLTGSYGYTAVNIGVRY